MKVKGVVLWGAFVAAQVAWTAYITGRRGGVWRFGPNVVFFVLLSVGVWGLQFVYIWRARRPRVTEITREGVWLTDPTTLRGRAWFPRGEIRCMNLVHGERGMDDLPTCALRLVLRRGWLEALDGGRERMILRGPAAQLREIGERVRQVLDGEEVRGVG